MFWGSSIELPEVPVRRHLTSTVRLRSGSVTRFDVIIFHRQWPPVVTIIRHETTTMYPGMSTEETTIQKNRRWMYFVYHLNPQNGMSSVDTVEKGNSARPRRVADVDKRRARISYASGRVRCSTSFCSSYGPAERAVSQQRYVPKGDLYNLPFEPKNLSFFAKALKNDTFPIWVFTPSVRSSNYFPATISNLFDHQSHSIYIIWHTYILTTYLHHMTSCPMAKK